MRVLVLARAVSGNDRGGGLRREEMEVLGRSLFFDWNSSSKNDTPSDVSKVAKYCYSINKLP